MRATVIIMLILCAFAAVPSPAGDNGGAEKRANEVGWDRVCINDGALLYDGPERTAAENGPTADRWTFAKWLETSEVGTEHVRLTNGQERWVERHDFYPVYRVTGDEPVEVLGVYYKDAPPDGTKPGKKPDAAKVIGHLDPGELAAGNPIAQAFNNTLPIENEAGLVGYVDLNALELVGEPGWGTAHPDSLELFPVDNGETTGY